VIARLESQSWRLLMLLTLCVFPISGAGHAHAPPSCAETCFQALDNRFLTQGGAPAVGYSWAGLFVAGLQPQLEFVMAGLGVLSQHGDMSVLLLLFVTLFIPVLLWHKESQK